ncbi:MAG: glycosyltransferase [Deltaproteobacteria bacterium]|nr:glycosyltransferase [Deltaproteobacteria bacterium]
MKDASESPNTGTQSNLPEVSLVVPVHNEAAIIEGSIRELHARTERHIRRPFEIIIAENGSRDETFAIAEEVAHDLPEVRLLRLPEPNYGAALRMGIMASRGKYIHCDEIDICDVDFHRRALELLVGEDGGFDLVVGSKTMHGARDRRPVGRRLATRVLNGALRASLGFHGTDTHGLKAFRRQALLPVVESCVVDRDMFASELVIRAERAGKRIVEIPLNLQEKREPSIRLTRRVPRVIRNLGQLVWVIRVKGSWSS